MADEQNNNGRSGDNSWHKASIDNSRGGDALRAQENFFNGILNRADDNHMAGQMRHITEGYVYNPNDDNDSTHHGDQHK